MLEMPDTCWGDLSDQVFLWGTEQKKSGGKAFLIYTDMGSTK